MNTRTATRLENALWLLDGGTHPTRVAARLGMTVQALDRMLHRCGQPRPAVRDEATYQRRQTQRKDQ